jgi:hypothetical protein
VAHTYRQNLQDQVVQTHLVPMKMQIHLESKLNESLSTNTSDSEYNFLVESNIKEKQLNSHLLEKLQYYENLSISKISVKDNWV